jgi:7-cyano-7-deazaguanine synthase
MRTAALVSGGLDSCVMLRELALQGTALPVYVRTGMRWESAEIHWLKRFLASSELARCEALTILELPVSDLYGDHWSITGERVPGFSDSLESNYLPGRNLLLLSKVVVFCALRGAERIAMAPLSDNPFPDGTNDFFQAFAAAATVGLAHPLHIDVPFRDLTKRQVVLRGKDLPLELTFSCIQPDGFVHCGRCTKCAERQHGFAAAGISDPTEYQTPRATPATSGSP